MMMPDDFQRSSKRLPVNPRRHKVAPEQRKRVATACNGCNVRRIKCSGETPCKQCASSSRECVYPAAVEKVHVAKSELDELKRRAELFERALQDAVPEAARRQELVSQVTSSPASSYAAETTSPGSMASSASAQNTPVQFTPSQEPSISSSPSLKTEIAITTEEEEHSSILVEGRYLQDQDGITTHYLGETSQAALLDHLKEFIGSALPLVNQHHRDSQVSPEEAAFLSSVGKLDTLAAQPLHDLDVDPLWLPPRNNLTVMLAELRQILQDGNGAWLSGGIFWWGDFTSLPPRRNTSSADDVDPSLKRQLAFYHAGLAVACQAAHTKPRITASDRSQPFLSETFFTRATALLFSSSSSNPLDMSRNSAGDVGTLALLGFYLLEMERPEAAQMYVAAAARTALACGLHRGWGGEEAKRVFWTVYVLDRWLSLALGRPPVIPDDAIRLSLPVDAPGMPPAAGLRAHAELSRIAGYIYSSTSSPLPRSSTPPAQSQHLQKTTWVLSQWRSALPPSLQLPPSDLDALTAGAVSGNLADPGCVQLHMLANHLLTLAARPLIFAAAKRSFAERVVTQRSYFEANPYAGQLREAAAAARSNLRLARHLARLRNSSVSSPPGRRVEKLLQTTLGQVFDAAVWLLLHELASDDTTPTDDVPSSSSVGRNDGDVDFAIHKLAEAGQLGSEYARDRAVALRHLGVLISRLKDAGVVDPALSVDGGVGGSVAVGQEGMYEDLVEWMNDWPAYGVEDFHMEQ